MNLFKSVVEPETVDSYLARALAPVRDWLNSHAEQHESRALKQDGKVRKHVGRADKCRVKARRSRSESEKAKRLAGEIGKFLAG